MRVRGWDKQTNQWVGTASFGMGDGSKGQGETTFTIGTSEIDRIIVQDGYYGRGYGWNSLMVFKRY